MSSDEQIMCIDNDPNVPGVCGITQTPVGKLYYALDTLAKPLLRSAVEGDTSYKQLVTYVVITVETKDGPLVLCYERLKGGTDERLHNAMSIGFGGHVQWREGLTAAEMIYSNMLSELNEELHIPQLDVSQVRFLGEMHVDIDDIGREHMGIVYFYTLTDNNHMNEIYTKEPEKMRLFWTPVPYLPLIYDRLESWSKVVAIPLKDGIL